jgi:hypothetical protein
MSKYFYGDPMQFKLTLFFSLLFSSFPVYSIEGETFFNYAKEIVIQMEKDNELEGKTKHRVMKEMLSTKDLTYECSRMDFNKITYDHCAMSQDVMRLPDDRTGGFVAGMAGAAAERVLERVYDRVIDRGLDQVERKAERVKKEIEASDRRERETRASERARSSRCNHSVPSIRGGDCA